MKQLMIGGISLLVIVMSLLGQDPEEKVAFLDVGQGDAILLQDGTQQVLIDGGQGDVVLDQLAKEMPWFDSTIEVLVLTHPQQDHMEGLVHVLKRYDVGLVLLPHVSHKTQLQEVWLDEIEKLSVPYRFAWAGQGITVGDIYFKILNPIDSDKARAAVRADLNNASVIARVDFHDLSFLMTGDTEKRMEKILVAENRSELLNVDVLKVGHHGSKSSTSEEFLNKVTPDVAVISSGKDNRFGHPHEEVTKRLIELTNFDTQNNGAVVFSFERNNWLLKTRQ